MGLDPLIHFEAIARHCSLKAAATELHLSRPAITHSLKKLESGLGVSLCLRSRSGFRLTEAGGKLYLVCQEIRARLQTYEECLLSDEAFDRVLNVGMIDNFQNPYLDKAIPKLIKTFPKLKLSLQVYEATELQRLILDGEVDVGLGIFNLKLDPMSYRTVGTETIAHFISDRHPLWRSPTNVRLGLGVKTWVDIINRNRSALENEIFGGTRSQQYRSYASNLNSALLLLQSGQSIVPLPTEYLTSRKLKFKFRSLDHIFKPFALKQEIAFRREFLKGSRACTFFVAQFPAVKSGSYDSKK